MCPGPPGTADSAASPLCWQYRANARETPRTDAPHGHSAAASWAGLAHAHVVDHPLAQRAGGVNLRFHGLAPVGNEADYLCFTIETGATQSTTSCINRSPTARAV